MTISDALCLLLGPPLLFTILIGCDPHEPDKPVERQADPPAALEVACRLIETDYGPVGTTPVDVEVVGRGLEVPWGIAFLPGGDLLVTERAGRISRIYGSGTVRLVATVELGASTAEGGLMGLALHPDFDATRWFYVYSTALRDGAIENVVERWTMSEDGASAAPERVIVGAIPALQFHNGGRIHFGPDGQLYIGTGDAGRPELAQDLGSLAGKILRVTDEGRPSPGNPFGDSPVWALGIRNTQGFAWRADGRMVMTDHGPSGLPAEGGRSGHDELNVVEAGANLGWPTAYACEVGDGVSPSMTWAAPMPPGGTAIYTGDAVADWAGDVFIGVLGIGGAIGHLHRARIAHDGNVVLHETYFLGEGFGRIREVAMGPDGFLYFGTSGCDGRGECGEGDAIFRVVPAR